jgi:hypothetical protein
MAYKVKEVVALPVFEGDVATGESVRKEPGDRITKKEFEEAHQDNEAIASLVKDGAIEEE